ncbi:hypothetical protein Leryth_005447 [Lithospermum erythrorhizon]|nr:hypothetical protein Leryth_005447 [Lithospermum erythrorhizon]
MHGRDEFTVAWLISCGLSGMTFWHKLAPTPAGGSVVTYYILMRLCLYYQRDGSSSGLEEHGH